MSRNLPAQPNLEHLKNQAKGHLDELRARNPGAQLADALHLVAKEYGFATWPALKEYVLSRAPLAHPLAGRWVADVARSQRHASNSFRSATMEFAVDGDIVTVSHVMIDETGRQERQRQTIRADGIEHMMPNGYVLLATLAHGRVLETRATHNGEVVGSGRYEVSADARTLVITGDGQRIVCARHQTAKR
jgi:hypothetical protein